MIDSPRRCYKFLKNCFLVPTTFKFKLRNQRSCGHTKTTTYRGLAIDLCVKKLTTYRLPTITTNHGRSPINKPSTWWSSHVIVNNGRSCIGQIIIVTIKPKLHPQKLCFLGFTRECELFNMSVCNTTKKLNSLSFIFYLVCLWVPQFLHILGLLC